MGNNEGRGGRAGAHPESQVVHRAPPLKREASHLTFQKWSLASKAEEQLHTSKGSLTPWGLGWGRRRSAWDQQRGPGKEEWFSFLSFSGRKVHPSHLLVQPRTIPSILRADRISYRTWAGWGVLARRWQGGYG